MKYMLTWAERPQVSPIEYENAQKRILEVFTQWKAPSNFKIELFVIRVGDWGGYMLLDCDDPTAVHKFCSMLPAFVFEVRPVIPIDDAVRVELEFIAYRDGLKQLIQSLWANAANGRSRHRPISAKSSLVTIQFVLVRTASNASGSLVTFTSRAILPVSSTMETLVSLTKFSQQNAALLLLML